MVLTKEGQEFFARGTYAERMIPKTAGFRWDPALRAWKTRSLSAAYQLREYAFTELREELEMWFRRTHSGQAEEVPATEIAPTLETSPPHPETVTVTFKAEKRRGIIKIEPEGAMIDALDAEFFKYQEMKEQVENWDRRVGNLIPTGEIYARAVRNLESSLRQAKEGLELASLKVTIAKLSKALDHIRGAMRTHRKVVVFTEHNDILGAIWGSVGSCLLVTESSSQENRQRVSNDFNTSAKSLILATLNSVDDNFRPTSADIMIFVELNIDPEKIYAAENCCIGENRSDPIDIQYLVVNGSLDHFHAESIIKKLEAKDSVITQTVTVNLREAVDGILSSWGSSPTRSRRNLYTAQRLRPVRATVINSPEDLHEEQPNDPGHNLEKKELVKRGLQAISSRCDGAFRQDGRGFSRYDARIGRSLAGKTTPLSDRQLEIGLRLVRKYRNQVPAEIMEALELQE